MVDVTCLYSVVKNVSGHAMTFPFIGPHGVKLAAAESYSVPGDVREAVMCRTPGRRSLRRFEMLERALGNNSTNTQYLEIVSTPAPVFYDETDEVSVILAVDNDVVIATAPCWTTSV